VFFETSIIIGIYSDILRADVMIVTMTMVIIGRTSGFLCHLYHLKYNLKSSADCCFRRWWWWCTIDCQA